MTKGKPVVATSLDELHGVPGVSLADSTLDFIEAIEAAMAGGGVDREVAAFINRNNWHSRVDELLEAVAGGAAE